MTRWPRRGRPPRPGVPANGGDPCPEYATAATAVAGRHPPAPAVVGPAQRGRAPLGRADHGRCGWVLPSGGRGGGGVLGMDLLRSLAPPAAVDGRGAATGHRASVRPRRAAPRDFRVLGCSI